MRLAGYSNTVVGAYDMDFHDTPYFLRKVNVTTLDSFVLNMFKLPVSEITRGMKGWGLTTRFRGGDLLLSGCV